MKNLIEELIWKINNNYCIPKSLFTNLLDTSVTTHNFFIKLIESSGYKYNFSILLWIKEGYDQRGLKLEKGKNQC